MLICIRLNSSLWETAFGEVFDFIHNDTSKELVKKGDPVPEKDRIAQTVGIYASALHGGDPP